MKTLNHYLHRLFSVDVGVTHSYTDPGDKEDHIKDYLYDQCYDIMFVDLSVRIDEDGTQTIKEFWICHVPRRKVARVFKTIADSTTWKCIVF